MNIQLSVDTSNKAELVQRMLCEIEDWPYGEIQDKIKDSLKGMFQKYHSVTESQRKRLDQLINQHRQYCFCISNDSYTRQHNTFVLLYVMTLPIREVARNQVLNIRTVYRDIDVVLNRMLISLLGFYGIRWDK